MKYWVFSRTTGTVRLITAVFRFRDSSMLIPESPNFVPCWVSNQKPVFVVSDWNPMAGTLIPPERS